MVGELETFIKVIRDRVIEWEKRSWIPYPWRVDRTPYKVLIAEILLKRTTRQAVLKNYQRFLEGFPDINAIYNAPLSELEEALRHLGLYKQRAQHLKDLAKVLVERYGGRIPDTWEELVDLPGLGTYIAGAVLSFGYGKRAPVVDSNVMRLLTRLTGIQFKRPEECLDLVWVLVPEEGHDHFNYGFIDLGATVCHYRKPKCSSCPLQDLCVYSLSSMGAESANYIKSLYANILDLGTTRTKIGRTKTLTEFIKK